MPKGEDTKLKNKKTAVVLIVAGILIVGLLVGIFMTHGSHGETIKDLMKDAVLHEHNKIDLFGLIEVNPAVISAFTVTK